MINIQNKIDYCGCNACGDVCAHGAITYGNLVIVRIEIDNDR